MELLVWKSNSRIVGASIYNHERNCSRTFFKTPGGITKRGLDHELDSGSSGGEARIMVGFGRVMVDGGLGENFSVWLDLGDIVFNVVAGGVGLFVCKI